MFQLFTIYTKSTILDVWLRSEYASGAVTYFRKKLILMFDWVLDTSDLFKGTLMQIWKSPYMFVIV